MTNRQIAAVLFNISAILSAQHGNPYRIRAYRRAARRLLRLRQPIAERVANGRPLGIPGLGKSLTQKISTLAKTGTLPFYNNLCAELPHNQHILLVIPGLGPKSAARIQRDLGAITPENLSHAIVTGKLQRIWGIGPKRIAAILNTLPIPIIRQEHMDLN